MRLYRIDAMGDFGAYRSKAIWVGTKSDIPKAKRAIRVSTDDLHVGPDITEFDVPTNKKGLLEFLNNHAGLTV